MNLIHIRLFYQLIIVIIMHKLILLLIFTVSTLANTCHYSCTNCTGAQYVSCLTCPSGSFVETVEDPLIMPSKYWSSVYPSGTCVQTFAPAANGLGIVVFLLIIGICLFFRTKESFYLLLTFQTYGLYNLIEIAWVNPIGYILQSFQYMMIFNVISYGYKTEDWVLIASKNYRLNKYLQTTSIGQNIPLIAAFTIIPLVILIVLSIIAIRKQKRAKQKKQEDVIFEAISGKSSQTKRKLEEEVQQQDDPDQSCMCWKTFSEEVLIKLAKFLLCFMFFMVQETCLVLLVTLVYVTPVSPGIIVLCVIYLHILIFVMSYSYYYRIEYFKTKKVMYVTYAKKIVLPVLVVVPIQSQWVFFVFAAAFLIIDFVCDKLNGLYLKLNRLAVYKIIQMVTVFILIIYYIVERHAMNYSSSRAAAIACTFVMVINLFIFICVEIPISIKEKYFPSNKVDQSEMEISEKDKEAVMQEDTLDNLNGDEDDKNKAHILVLENVHGSQSQGSNDSDDEKNKLGINGNGDGLNGDDRNNRDNSITKDGNSSIGRQNANNVAIEDIQDNDGNGNNGSGNKQGNGNGSGDEKGNGEDSDEQRRRRLQQKKEKGQEQVVPPKEPPKKKRRKQILDPELRMRYGI